MINAGIDLSNYLFFLPQSRYKISEPALGDEVRQLVYLLLVLTSFSIAYADQCPPGQKNVWRDANGNVLAGGAAMGQTASVKCEPIEPEQQPEQAQPAAGNCQTFDTQKRRDEVVNYNHSSGLSCSTREEQVSGKTKYLMCCQGASNGAEPQCSQQAQQLKAQCAADAESAKNSCDSQNGDWQAKITRTLEVASVGMRQVANTSLEMACSKMNEAMAGVNTALGAFELNCNQGRSACMTSCEEAHEAYNSCIKSNPQNAGTSVPEEITTNQRECRSYQSRLDDAIASVANVGSSFVMAKSCKEFAESNDRLGDLTQNDTCKQNPTAPGCEGPQNCSNPKFSATNTVCICLSNPSDSRCGAGGGRLAGGGTLLPGGGKGGALLPGSGSGLGNLTENTGGGGLFEPPMGQPGSLAGEDPGGKKAGAPMGGGGSAGLGGGDGQSGGSVARDAQGNPVLKGFYGGSGGSGGMYGSSGAGGRGPGSDGNGYLRPGEKVPDLDKYRPDGLNQKLRPGMAGLVGPDGITSQHDNIFAKIKNRYNAKSMTLK